MIPKAINLIDLLIVVSIVLSIYYVKINQDCRSLGIKILYAMRLCFTLAASNQSVDFIYSIVSHDIAANNLAKLLCYIGLLVCWYGFFSFFYHHFFKQKVVANIPERHLFILVAWVGNLLVMYMMLVMIIKLVTILYPFCQWPPLFNHSIILQYAYQTGDNIFDFLRDDEVRNVGDGYHLGRMLKFIR